MLVEFNSPDSSRFTMLGKPAVQLLHFMGCTGKVPGGLDPEDVGAALQKLRTALKQTEEAATEVEGTGNSAQDWDADDAKVLLKLRAGPLVAMLDAAHRAESYITWTEV